MKKTFTLTFVADESFTMEQLDNLLWDAGYRNELYFPVDKTSHPVMKVEKRNENKNKGTHRAGFFDTGV